MVSSTPASVPSAVPARAIRLARAADMPAVCELVNGYIATSVANFHTEPRPPEEWLARWRQLHEAYPWYVAEVAGEIAGVCYAAPWSPRGAYAWTAESTIYVSPRHRRSGLGSELYDALLASLERQGFHSVIAGITLPNPGSVALHEARGFVPIGAFRSTGYKHDAWHDVGYWQCRLAAEGAPPSPLRPVGQGHPTDR